MQQMLSQAIESFLIDIKHRTSHEDIKDAYLALQKQYAELKHTSKSSVFPIVDNETKRIAYLLSRMPATYSVGVSILQSFTDIIDSNEIDSLLDLGTGSGAILWAVLESSLKLSKITALDQDSHILTLAKKLANYSSNPSWEHVAWAQQDVNQAFTAQPHDLVTMSYALIEQAQITSVLENIWPLFNKALILIEPGTSKGFANIHLARDYFIQKGAHIAAPCSHLSECPMKDDNWCHFTKRLERTKWQQNLKDATLGYEDEAYSYLIVTKFPVQPQGHRILSNPIKRSGHLILNLCAPHEIKRETITRSQKTVYKIAKKKKWGDTWGD